MMAVRVEQSESIAIGRPQHEVWRLTGDPRAWSAWTSVRNVRTTPEGPLAAGTEVTYGYGEHETHATIAEFSPERLLAIQASEPGYDFLESVALAPNGAGTLATMTMGFATKTLVYSALAVLAKPFKRWVLGRPLRKDLLALRAAAEAGSSEAPSP
jgi:hypothetical protein